MDYCFLIDQELCVGSVSEVFALKQPFLQTVTSDIMEVVVNFVMFAFTKNWLQIHVFLDFTLIFIASWWY